MINWLVGKPFLWFSFTQSFKRQSLCLFSSALFMLPLFKEKMLDNSIFPSSEKKGLSHLSHWSHLSLLEHRKTKKGLSHLSHLSLLEHRKTKKGLSHLSHLSLLEHRKTKKGLSQQSHLSHLSLQFVNELPAMKFIA